MATRTHKKRRNRNQSRLLRAGDLMLILLAVATAAIVLFAFNSIQRIDAGADSLDGAAVSKEVDTSTETAGSTPEFAVGNLGAPTEDEPTLEDEPKSAEDQVQSALSGRNGEPVSVLVLGDDTSNLRSEWVQLWGAELADSRPVTVVHWDEAADVRYATPDVMAETGEGGPLTIWSASRTGADIPSVTARLSSFLDRETLGAEPDLVVFNLGANDSADEVVADVQELADSVAERLGQETPVVLVRQGQGGASSEVDEVLVGWAQAAGVVVWDARGATTAQGWAEVVAEQSVR